MALDAQAVEDPPARRTEGVLRHGHADPEVTEAAPDAGGRAAQVLSFHEAPVRDVAVVPGGGTAVSVGEGGQVELWRISPDRKKTPLAHDRWGILLGRPTNLAFGGKNFDDIFVANLGRYTITRAKLGIRGQPPANLQGT